ncbi:MAG TPA: TIGR04053 family radical SAM/SPASM domain-containing protein [Candidatus Dormibacteraeota bacterium]|nr:TIGR04053 family radical SAM/SPASM domain-containing protein [Candidatus Dormibacteraeota bacterium]
MSGTTTTGTARPGALNFKTRPLLVFWETTRACLLACKHCRASALAEPLPGQLSPESGKDLIRQVSEFGRPAPVLVLTGGDVLMRQDAYELATYALSLGIPTCLSPSVTPLLTQTAIVRMKRLRVRAVSISLDGGESRTHEQVRGVAGHFEETLQTIRALVAADLRVQVNTTVMRSTVEELADVAAIVSALGAQIWEVFFLIGVGRGAQLRELDAPTNEEVCHFLFDASRYGFVVRTVEAPFFRRVSRWRRAREERLGRPESLEEVRDCFGLGELYGRLRRRLEELIGPGRGHAAAHSVSTRDGKGVIFVAHDGQVHPSGFLPLPLGNARSRHLSGTYRNHPLLRAIRSAQFTGRCGVCDFRDICGGSRARAFAASGDPLAEDPGCAFDPRTLRTSVRRVHRSTTEFEANSGEFK